MQIVCSPDHSLLLLLFDVIYMNKTRFIVHMSLLMLYTRVIYCWF